MPVLYDLFNRKPMRDPNEGLDELKNWKESDTLEYPEKKLQILEAVRRLIGQGTDLQKLRAGDIAREAGVGKGLFTFTLIPRNNHRGNLCYMMELRISALEETAQKPGTFRERAIRLLKCFQQQEQSGDSALRMLLSTKASPYCGRWGGSGFPVSGIG